MGRVALWVRPGSHQDRMEWDDWRQRWVVSVRDPPAGGKANDGVVRMLAQRLGVPRSSVRIGVGGRTRTKLLEVDGLADAEISARLRATLSRRAPNAGPTDHEPPVQTETGRQRPANEFPRRN